MATNQNATLVRRLFDEVWNGGNVSLMESIFSPKVKFSDPAAPSFSGGLPALKKLESDYQTAFPNKKNTIEDIYVAGDNVIVRWTMRATHSGSWHGISATNKKIQISGITIYTFSNGKVVDVAQNWDYLGLLEQLGAVSLQKIAA